MSKVSKFVPFSSLSNKEFFDIHLDAGETAQVDRETLFGPCWAVVTSYTEPKKNGKKGLVWKRGEVRLSAQNPVARSGRISRAWCRHFHPQATFRFGGADQNPYWMLPEFTGEQNPELFPVWRITAAGGYVPEAPAGFVVVSPTTLSGVSWILMREDDPRIEEVWDR